METECVMLSLESVEKRLDNPKAYYVFYDYFYKAAVGDRTWKDCMERENVRIGNNTTEAFALLIFANSYKAWLYEEKRKYGPDLQTEYDSDQGEQGESGSESGEKVSIVDQLLLDQEFDLDEDADELLVRVTTDEKYKKAMKARKDWLLELKNLPICLEIE